jgi:hypothetical protein
VTIIGCPPWPKAEDVVVIGVSFPESLDLKALPAETYISRRTVTS